MVAAQSCARMGGKRTECAPSYVARKAQGEGRKESTGGVVAYSNSNCALHGAARGRASSILKSIFLGAKSRCADGSYLWACCVLAAQFALKR